VKVTLLLADSAQAVEGKLYILGGGWSFIGPDPSPMALAAKIEIPWNQTNEQHQLKLELMDSDGELVTPEGGEGPVVVEGTFEVGRPVGIKPGTPLDFPFAVNIGPLPLKPNTRYVWQLSIDGHTNDDWRVAFTTRPARVS
jgi:hypothetical protein